MSPMKPTPSVVGNTCVKCANVVPARDLKVFHCLRRDEVVHVIQDGSVQLSSIQKRGKLHAVTHFYIHSF